MKILIGTPIHESKDYCMKKWLKNVSDLRNATPADFLMIDNSPDRLYVKKVKEYCHELGIKNYSIKHINIDQKNEIEPMSGEKIHQRVAIAREPIRKEILSKNYDAWFSWECDQIIPNNALDKLIEVMKSGNYQMINHNGWSRDEPKTPNTDLGVSLVSKNCLKDFSFLERPKDDANKSDSWVNFNSWFKKRVINKGGGFIEVYGIINPIYHI